MPANTISETEGLALRAKRVEERGKRPVKVANVSGCNADPPWQMLRQAIWGDIDFITGDWLAEMNIAENAEAYKSGTHPGYVKNAWDGFLLTIDEIANRGIKVVINGGGLNPSGLAEKVATLSREHGHKLKVAYVSGDDLLPILGDNLASLKETLPPHIDSDNPDIKLPWNILDPEKDKTVPLVAASAYLGARAIVKGLREGADIIICGRVADASPVIGAAWYWHNWSDTDYDHLAGSLVAGHLIECSTYVSGGNFSGFTTYDQKLFVEPGFPIAEIDEKGACVIMKHDGAGGMITEDTVRCQLLYELQGAAYLNSDVKGYVTQAVVKEVGKDRIHVSGITGAPPPPTTKAAIFYPAGYQSQLLVNAAGYGTDQKYVLLEKQLRKKLAASGADKSLSILEFQKCGIPEPNPRSQLASTTYLRIFAEAKTPEPLYGILTGVGEISLQHFSGMHSSMDWRTAIPKPFLAYYPSLFPQDKIPEVVTFLNPETSKPLTPISAGHPPKYEALERRENHPVTASPLALSTFGPTKSIKLGDIALGRSGDKGSNLNAGFFVQTPKAYEWFKSFLSTAKFIELLGEDWDEKYFVERVEFPNIFGVHFVVYGILGRGVSSSSRLDCLGKGFADYLRDKVVEVPVEVWVDARL